MRQALVRWSAETDESQRKRILVEYATMLSLWVEYTLEHLDWLARAEESQPGRPPTSTDSRSGL